MAYATSSQMWAYLAQVDQGAPALTPENEQLFTELLDRASAQIDDVTVGVTPEILAASRSVEQICLELAVNMWRQKDRGLWASSSGVDGEGALIYTGVFTDKQLRLLRQLRIRNAGIPT